MSKPVFKSTAAPGSPPAAGGARKGLASFTEELAAGDYVFREGELGTEMLILQEGQVEILKTLDGVDEQLAVLEKGDFFGEMSLLEDLPRTATARAVTPCKLIRIDGATFDQMLRNKPEIAVRIMRKLSRRPRQTDQMLREALGGAGGAAEAPPPLGHGVPPLDQLRDAGGTARPGDRHPPRRGPHPDRHPALHQPAPRQALPPRAEVLRLRGDRDDERHLRQRRAGADGGAGRGQAGGRGAVRPREAVVPGGVTASAAPGRHPAAAGIAAAPDASPAHPRPLDLRSPLRALAGVGPRTAAALAGAGLETVGDLLAHLPREYEDRRTFTRVADARPGAPVQLRGELEAVRARRAGRRLLVEATLRDASGSVGVTWFGQPWLADRLRGAGTVTLHGSLRVVGRKLVLSHPEWAPAAGGEEGIVPIYPEVTGIGSLRLRGWIAEALERLDLERQLGEPVAEELLARHALPRQAEAVRLLHQPAREADRAALAAWQTPAHARLVYGELLAQQLVLATRAAAQRRLAKPHRYRVDDAVRARAREILPFALTAAQKRAVRELVGELAAPPPMRRLLQGDVGSGKTVVAALRLLLAAESGLQGALLAPTELLAEQHHAALSRLLGRHHPVLLLAGGRGSDAERKALRRGQVKVVVGTQALLQEGVAFQHLALVVIDEQHRFGVRQRRLLEEKGYRPDLLVMSAPPIPPSLA